jgi:hypothetical protein|tara:strand:+ start:179 stop:1759 length:1581 start_codon:yes stop_codon:yes gene_type:complete
MIKKFRDIFIGLEERFGYHVLDQSNGDGKKSGTSFTSSYAHTEEMWKAHLEGIKFEVKTKNKVIQADSLGLCPIRSDSTCFWGAIDLDEYKPDVKELYKKIKSLNVPFIPFKSKSGGIHVYIFLTEPVKALLLREKLHSIKNIFGDCKPDKIFPVQKYLNLERGSAGSWINLPYHNVKKTVRYMIKEDGSPATIEEFFEHYERNKVTPQQLKKLKSNIDEGDAGDWFKDGPPCMQALAKFGVPKSQRNEVLLDMTRYVKQRFPDEWKDKTLEYNKKFFEPIGKGMNFNEVSGVIGSREKKDYIYRCDQDWLKTYCNKEECIKRKFGIKGALNNELILGPLSYVTSNPKIWYLGFNGEEVRLFSKELVKQDLAREAATEQTSKTPPKTKTWDMQIRGLQEKATEIDAPEESVPMFRLKTSLETFCFNTRVTKDRKKMLLGRPFEDETFIRFTFNDFFKYLKSDEWSINADITHQMLKKVTGVTREKFHVKEGVKRWVYVVDKEKFDIEPETEQEIPDYTNKEDESAF